MHIMSTAGPMLSDYFGIWALWILPAFLILTLILVLPGGIVYDLILDGFERYFAAKDLRAIEARRKHRIGYKYANIGTDGLLGLVAGKPYGIVEELDGSKDLKSGGYGFHSYKSLKILREKSAGNAQFDRGLIVLEVVHFGEVEEYSDGWLSTGQRVLQIAPGDKPCFNEGLGGCSGDPTAAMCFPLRVSLVFCDAHFEDAQKKTRWIPGRKVVNIARWLDSMDSNVGDRVRINRSLSELEPLRIL